MERGYFFKIVPYECFQTGQSYRRCDHHLSPVFTAFTLPTSFVLADLADLDTDIFSSRIPKVHLLLSVMSVYNPVLFHLHDPNEQFTIICPVIYKSSVKNDGQVVQFNGYYGRSRWSIWSAGRCLSVLKTEGE